MMRNVRPSNGTSPAPSASAHAVGLRYVSDEAPGIRRIRAGKGFRYTNGNGAAVRDAATLARIRSLVIPPAWKDVWICTSPEGHVQATGRDARGRKQHRYHPRWRETRDASKYDRMLEFAKALPRIRRRVQRDLSRRGLERERVLATVIRLIDLTFIRVGNEEYAKDNNSYGLTTMRNRHAAVRGATIRFQFRGKSGKTHDISVSDARLARIVKQCQDIPGQELFQYYDDNSEKRPVTSGDVNEYLREIGGGDFTTRDFRTWAGTVLTMQLLARSPAADSESEARKTVLRAVEQVAGKLGNTVAVCRKCYVHPLVFQHYIEGKLGGEASTNGSGLPVIENIGRPRTGLAPDEKRVLEFLTRSRRNGSRKH